MTGMQVGLLIGHEGVLHDAFPLEIVNVAVVVEETIILHDLRDVPLVLLCQWAPSTALIWSTLAI